MTPKPSQCPARAMAWAGVAFAIVSVAVFSLWAFAGRWFYRNVGEAGFYAACAVLFLLLSGLVLHPLILGERKLARFYRVFTAAFAAYAVVWCLAWFAMRGRWGEWLGSLAGSVVFALIVTRAFSNPGAFWKAAAVLFVAHSLGYFSGSIAMYWILGSGGAELLPEWSADQRAVLAKLSWGLLYGAGFGAGLGYCFHAAQRPRCDQGLAASEGASAVDTPAP